MEMHRTWYSGNRDMTVWPPDEACYWAVIVSLNDTQITLCEFLDYTEALAMCRLIAVANSWNRGTNWDRDTDTDNADYIWQSLEP